MKINTKIEEIIREKTLASRIEKEPSGRLSASRLGWPLQWQMLHYYKIPQKEVDEFVLRKFARGEDVEERIMKWLSPAETAMQVPVEYRGVVGFVDVVLDYPIEIKSVTNKNFSYIQKDGIKRGHKLQAELYAKSLGYDKYAVAYVASDDYRVLCIEDTVTDDVDTIIDEYEQQVLTGIVPIFQETESWQKLEEYNSYPEWMKLDQEQINEKLSGLGITTTKPLL